MGHESTFDEIKSGPAGSFIQIIKHYFSSGQIWGDTPNGTLDYFLVNDPKLEEKEKTNLTKSNVAVIT